MTRTKGAIKRTIGLALAGGAPFGAIYEIGARMAVQAIAALRDS